MSAMARASRSSGSRDLCLPFDLALRAAEHVAPSTADFDSARPHRLGYLALELDREKTVDEIGARHLHMISY